MTRWATLAVALLFCVVASVQYAGTASGQAGAGWTTLFDGKNLDHWQGDGTATFKIEEGSLIATDKKDPKAVAAYLVTKEPYKDFTIRAEFWVSNDANSGIYFRCEDPKNISTKNCYEANIFDQRKDPTYGTGALMYLAEVNPMPKVGGKWTTIEVTAKGRDLSLSLDGKKITEARNGMLEKGGVIALQFGVGTIKFRKIEIRPL